MTKMTDGEIYEQLCWLLGLLHQNKPGDRSAADRAWSVAITMMEQVVAYFKVWAMCGDYDGKAE